jgi:hypothetical protein
MKMIEKKYTVKSRYFNVSENGIHLLKNGIISKVIQYDSIERAVITRGIEVENSFILFVVGLLIFVFGFYLSFGMVNWVIRGEFAGSYRGLFILMIPFVGVYFIYSAFKRGPVIIIYGKGQTVKLPIREIVDRHEYQALQMKLSELLGKRLQLLLKIDP